MQGKMKVTEKEVNLFLNAKLHCENHWKSLVQYMVTNDKDDLNVNLKEKYQHALNGDKSEIKSVKNRLRTLRGKTK